VSESTGLSISGRCDVSAEPAFVYAGKAHLFGICSFDEGQH
jgi:hypothetical protein